MSDIGNSLLLENDNTIHLPDAGPDQRRNVGKGIVVIMAAYFEPDYLKPVKPIKTSREKKAAVAR